MNIRILLLSILVLFFSFNSFSATRRYRLSLRDDPSTSIVIGWEQNGGTSPMVYYGTTDYGQAWASYPNSQAEDKQINAHGMDNRFVRLTGLTPNTKYYFVIKDSDGTSARFWFKTTPMGNTEPLSVIAGGDSRAYLDSSPRQNANTLVAKLRPDFVLFGGDYTWLGLNLEWAEWMDDWQLTTSPDGRMYPTIWERGNHEMSAGIVYDLFDVPSTDEYFALSVGGNFLRIYTLNTEISVAGNQTTWLQNDLQTNYNNHDWNIVQYHRSTRPHSTAKPNEDGQYNAWAQLFYDYRVQLIVESDAHDVKTTWPIKPSVGPNSDDGFELDTLYGSVYIGEGCWGAPLRTNDWNKTWTRNSASFNSFHWLKISKDTIEIRTVGSDNASTVGSVSDNDRFALPTGIDIWNPSNGDVVYIANQKYINRPDIVVTHPFHQQFFNQPQQVNVTADASDIDGTVQNVKFFINDVFVGQDNSMPYELSWNIPTSGEFVITAWAIDNEGWHNISEEVKIYAGAQDITAQLASNDDDAEQHISDGALDLTSSDLELCVEQWIWPISDEDQWVGLRYTNLQIPQNATITNAYIQFTADENQSDPANLTIYGESIGSASSFTGINYNISSRSLTNSSVAWTPPAWTTDASGVDQQTPDITSIVQELVDQPNWQMGNAMAFLFEGTGTRSAYSRDTDPIKAATLHITFQYHSPDNVVENELNNLFNIYPNPATKEVRIHSNSEENDLVKIYSINGDFVQEQHLHFGTNVIAVNNLSKGVYLFLISQKDKRIVKKLIIQ